MDMNLFIDQVLAAAKAAGIDTAEVYYTAGENFRASALEGEINQYQVSAAVSFRLDSVTDRVSKVENFA